MFSKTKKPVPAATTFDQEESVIERFLEQIGQAYKGQDISAERMIEIELKLIADRKALGLRF